MSACNYILPAGRVQSVQPAGPKIALNFLHLLVRVCVPTYHVRNNYITYIVAMCFTLVDFRELLQYWCSYYE